MTFIGLITTTFWLTRQSNSGAQMTRRDVLLSLFNIVHLSLWFDNVRAVVNVALVFVVELVEESMLLNV